MTIIVPAPGVGLTPTQVQALIDTSVNTHLNTAPHFSQAQIQTLIDAGVNSAIANLMLPTYGSNYQGTRNDNVVPVSDGPVPVVSHTVLGVNNGEYHDIFVSFFGRKNNTTGDMQYDVIIDGNIVSTVLLEYKDTSAEQRIPHVMVLNEPLQNGDVIELVATDIADGTGEVYTSKIQLFETEQLQAVAAPSAVSISTPSTRFVTTFWNQMAGDPNGTASTTIVPTVSGGVGPFTFAWTITQQGGTGSPLPALTSSPTAQNGTASATTLATSYIRDFDMTVTVTDTGTGLTDSSTTAVNFNISEISN